MFYEEKIINGVLCYRDGIWKEFTPVQYTNCLEVLKHKLRASEERAEALKKAGDTLYEALLFTRDYETPFLKAYRKISGL